jgi:hypothetical protein
LRSASTAWELHSIATYDNHPRRPSIRFHDIVIATVYVCCWKANGT